MEVRSFTIRSVDTEERTISGIAAPYNQSYDAGDYVERFEAGAFGDVTNVRLYAEHDHLALGVPIGMVTKGEDTEDGFLIEARISDTTKGNDVYQLLKDGVLKNFSVGFEPLEDRIEDDGTVVRTKVNLREVSVVANPAYTQAEILAVRSDSETNNTNERGSIESTSTGNTNMSNDDVVYATAADLDEIRSDFDRRLAVAVDNSDKSDAGSQFRTAGAALKALADGSDAAKMEWRAYSGPTSAASHTGNDWKGDLLQIATADRKVINAFSKGAWADSGSFIEYPYVSGITGAAASQVNEGDDLSDLRLAISTRTAAKKTVGVKSELTFQSVKQSDVAILDATVRAQAQAYAKYTNDYVRSVLVGASAVAGAGFTLSSATGKDYLKAVIDGQQKIEGLGLGLTADVVLVSSDVFLAATTTADSGHFVFDVAGNAGSTLGSARGLSASIYGVPVVVDSGLAAKSLYVASTDAVMTWESNGAPVALSDENILNLTQAFSLHGFIAAAVKNANAIVKPAIA